MLPRPRERPAPQGGESMSHQPSSVMTDRDGEFQRCWECGARRRIAALGPGLWDTGPRCGPQEEVEAPARPERTRQELVDELYGQT